MELYHFTSIALSKTILSDCLSRGHLDLPEGGLIDNVVWFTTLPFPEGTGVPLEMKELNESELAHVQRVQGMVNSNLSSDKSRIRLSVDSESLRPITIANNIFNGLISFVEFCEKINAPKNWAKAIGISALHDLNVISREKFNQLLNDNNSSTEDAWYLHFGPVPRELITSVEYRIDKSYVPYDLNAHGREALAEVGIECVNSESIRELEKILKPSHKYELVHATIFCSNPTARKIVVIRGSGNICLVDIESKKQLMLHAKDPSYPEKEVQNWVANNVDELSRCWELALASYYRFHPET